MHSEPQQNLCHHSEEACASLSTCSCVPPSLAENACDKCNQASEYCILSSSVSTACWKIRQKTSKNLANNPVSSLQRLPCLPSKKGWTETCVSYTTFSLSLLLINVDVELLPPKTSALTKAYRHRDKTDDKLHFQVVSDGI